MGKNREDRSKFWGPCSPGNQEEFRGWSRGLNFCDFKVFPSGQKLLEPIRGCDVTDKEINQS